MSVLTYLSMIVRSSVKRHSCQQVNRRPWARCCWPASPTTTAKRSSRRGGIPLIN